MEPAEKLKSHGDKGEPLMRKVVVKASRTGVKIQEEKRYPFF